MKKRSLTSTTILFISVILLLKLTLDIPPREAAAAGSLASASLQTSNMTVHCDDCLVSDLESLMEFHAGSRLLINPAQAVTGRTANRNQPVARCGRYRPYQSCLPGANKPRPPPNCGVYNRECGR